MLRTATIFQPFWYLHFVRDETARQGISLTLICVHVCMSVLYDFRTFYE